LIRGLAAGCENKNSTAFSPHVGHILAGQAMAKKEDSRLVASGCLYLIFGRGEKI
jgi:hypothetical protein